MDFEIQAVAAASSPPVVVPALPARQHDADRTPLRDAPGRPVVAIPPPRRVELSIHADLKVLMMRVIDEHTGDSIREYPSRQVLDLVADVMRRMRAREEG